MEPPKEDLKPLAAALWDVLTPVRGKERNWHAANQWLYSKEILDGAIPEVAPELSAKRFREVIDSSRKELAR